MSLIYFLKNVILGLLIKILSRVLFVFNNNLPEGIFNYLHIIFAFILNYKNRLLKII
jgi:hypothetical protein